MREKCRSDAISRSAFQSSPATRGSALVDERGNVVGVQFKWQRAVTLKHGGERVEDRR